MKLKPLFRNVFIKPLDEQKTKSGIVLPDKINKEKPIFGEVVAIGSEVSAVKIGDKVIFKKYMPDWVKVDDKDYLVGLENDILAIVE